MTTQKLEEPQAIPDRGVFEGVSRGPRSMTINGRIRPAYEWCEMFGHQMGVPATDQCWRCGGLRDV